MHISLRRARIAAGEEGRAEGLQDAEQLIEEMKRNPALCRKMQVKAQQELEVQRDLAFQRMEDIERHRIYSLRSISQQIAGHKLFWAWREQALLEFRHLRQTERLDGDGDGDESCISTTSNNPADTANILPITTPAAFALRHHTPELLPWFRSGAGGTASSFGCPLGKRISFREMSQNRCNPKHYSWLKESVEFRLTKDPSCDDRTTQRSWPQLASLFWTDGLAASRTGKEDDRL